MQIKLVDHTSEAGRSVKAFGGDNLLWARSEVEILEEPQRRGSCWMSLLKWAGTFLKKVRVAGLSVCEMKKATTKKGTTTTTTATMETEGWMVGKEVGRRSGCPGVLVR